MRSERTRIIASMITHKALLSLAACLAPLAVGQTGPGRLADDLVRRWSFEEFWSLKKEFPYPVGATLTVQVFENRHIFGFCSFELQRCASYENRNGILGPLLVRRRLAKTAAAIEDLTKQFLNESPAVRDFTNDPVRLSIASLALKAPIPESISQKVTPPSVGSLTSWLKEEVLSSEFNNAIECVVPFYSDQDPNVYILIRNQDGRDTILEAGRTPAGLWTELAFFHLDVSANLIASLKKRIESAAMVTIKRD